ncbi:unnamed protein product [Paramecium pentaurelia]|uniref:Protein kinase domain-containing protein n=1 Tax=Paramecium pentaurelia TaxID=43138 RepID=A0A8S1YL93_9CILI|nr:unnamed protein product [Paramecium pentaurelia]
MNIRKPPRECLRSIENKENLPDNSSKPPPSRLTNYRLNNLTTYFKIRTPSRGRELAKFEDNFNTKNSNNEQRYLSTKESQQCNTITNNTNQQQLRLSSKIQRKRIQGNLSAKDSTNHQDSLYKQIPSTCDDKIYQIGPIIGKGSYAIVKMGTDRHGNKVAIKMYDKSLLKGERFNNLIKEINTLRILSHDQITKLYDVYHYTTYINLVMEYCGTESLYQLLKSTSTRTIPKEQALHIIHQLLKILHYIHDRNVCHRDIKLENILIQNKRIKLIDFGFSTFTNQPITCHCGTPSYMAPEVVSKLKYDGRAADIWATGVLLVALLQGSFPFKGENERELFKKIRNNESNITNQDRDILKLLSRIFVVDPYQRATAKELLQLDMFKS